MLGLIGWVVFIAWLVGMLPTWLVVTASMLRTERERQLKGLSFHDSMPTVVAQAGLFAFFWPVSVTGTMVLRAAQDFNSKKEG